MSWSNAPGNKLDWVGIYKAGDPDTYNYYGFLYIGAKPEGEIEFSQGDLYGGLEPGEYEARLMLDDGYAVLASAPFTVSADWTADRRPAGRKGAAEVRSRSVTVRRRGWPRSPLVPRAGAASAGSCASSTVRPTSARARTQQSRDRVHGAADQGQRQRAGRDGQARVEGPSADGSEREVLGGGDREQVSGYPAAQGGARGRIERPGGGLPYGELYADRDRGQGSEDHQVGVAPEVADQQLPDARGVGTVHHLVVQVVEVEPPQAGDYREPGDRDREPSPDASSCRRRRGR